MPLRMKLVDTYCLDIETECLDKYGHRLRGDETMTVTKNKAGEMPRWVKVFIGIGVAALAVVAFAVLSGHGPWQHMGMGGMH